MLDLGNVLILSKKELYDARQNRWLALYTVAFASLSLGLAYLALAVLAEPVTLLARAAPGALIAGVAGLALIPALVASLRVAFARLDQIEADLARAAVPGNAALHVATIAEESP